jgi:aspartate dehydrogenase
MAKLKIGIIGCGAIGTSLAKAIVRDLSGQAELSALFDVDNAKAEKLSLAVSKSKGLAVGSYIQVSNKSHLVIESASSNCSYDIAKAVLAKGRDVMIMSVGGIAAHIEELSSLARTHQAKVYIPSGAISGIDALKAAKLGTLKKVILTTRKNPAAFEGVKFIEDKKINLAGIKKNTVLFSGPASEAVKYFPQNINVAAVLSIAGLGRHKTCVKIIASPFIKRNIHEIVIESNAATISTRTENVLHPDNPKTSFLAVLSAIAVLRQILVPVKVGT